MHIIPCLKPGDKVAIVSPASPPKSTDWELGLKVLEQWGLEVIRAPNHLNTHFGLAGTDQQRLSDLQWALNEPDIKAIFPVRGGYGTSRIIDQVDFSNFAKYPKWIVGFSDITTLLMHLNALDFPSLHAPMPHNFLQNGGEIALINLKKFLFEGEFNFKTPPHPYNTFGKVEAPIIGGNLSILVHLIGTPSFPNPENTILFIEDIGERLYHVDRMMVQLKRSGILSQLAGMIVGGFSDCEEASLQIGKDAYGIIAEHTQDFNYPIAFDFPAGHIPNNQPLLMGQKISLLINSTEVQLTYTNP